MSLTVLFYDDPSSVVGHSFKFTSGEVALQGDSGNVIRVEEARNAVGKVGHVVIHTLEDGQIYRTRWSYFREHASLKDV
jgi:hypothetical protein